MFSKTSKFILVFSLICLANTGYSQENKKSLDSFIQKRINYNEHYPNGYSLLLYNGNEEEARKIKQDFKKEFRKIEIYLTYKSPNWKVMTKSYDSKLEAERISVIVREKYPNVKIL